MSVSITSSRLTELTASRRDFLCYSTSVLAFGIPNMAVGSELDVRQAILEDFGVSYIEAGPVVIDMPDYSDSGKSVPLTLSVPVSLDNQDYPEVIGVYADRNPRPRIAKVFFSPLCSEAKFSTRIRINAYQNIVAVAKMKSGKLYKASRKVDVTYGACEEAIASNQFPEGWQPSIKVAVPEAVQANGIIEIRTIIGHPMETGLRRNASGVIVPVRIVEWFRCYINEKIAFSVNLEPAIAANPYFSFLVKIAESSMIRFEWVDTNGQIYTEEKNIVLA
jgi:sulfur-oxidizing protein SoxY